MVAGVDPQSREGLLHVEAFSFCHHPLGLFDDDAAVESVLELLVEDLGLERGAVLEDGDGGHIGQGLGRFDIGPAISPGSTWNKLRAPMTVPRHRNGSAWTEQKPAASVSAANRGQRLVTVARSGSTTGRPLR